MANSVALPFKEAALSREQLLSFFPLYPRAAASFAFYWGWMVSILHLFILFSSLPLMPTLPFFLSLSWAFTPCFSSVIAAVVLMGVLVNKRWHPVRFIISQSAGRLARSPLHRWAPVAKKTAESWSLSLSLVLYVTLVSLKALPCGPLRTEHNHYCIFLHNCLCWGWGGVIHTTNWSFWWHGKQMHIFFSLLLADKVSEGAHIVDLQGIHIAYEFMFSHAVCLWGKGQCNLCAYFTSISPTITHWNLVLSCCTKLYGVVKLDKATVEDCLCEMCCVQASSICFNPQSDGAVGKIKMIDWTRLN